MLGRRLQLFDTLVEKTRRLPDGEAALSSTQRSVYHLLRSESNLGSIQATEIRKLVIPWRQFRHRMEERPRMIHPETLLVMLLCEWREVLFVPPVTEGTRRETVVV